MFRQPKGVFLLAFVQMWHRFSHYGLRVLLVLFMVQELKFSDGKAFGVFAVYSALVELGGLLGAYLAEKVLGLRRSVLLGGWIIGLGHLFLALDLFYLGLATIITGSSLFMSNVLALMGTIYGQGDQRRETGFTLFYMGINIGALLATILCATLAETMGWRWGFGVAAVGMLLANLALLKFRHLLSSRGEMPKRPKWGLLGKTLPLLTLFALGAMTFEQFALPMLPWITLFAMAFFSVRLWKDGERALPLALAALILFFTAEEQLGSSFLVYTERMGSGTFFGIPIATGTLLSVNPFIVISCGALAILLIRRIRSAGMRLALPFGIVSLAFLGLGLAGFAFVPKSMPLALPAAIVALISFAELLIGPMSYSLCSEVAERRKDPKIAALVPMGFSLAASLGGLTSKGLAFPGFPLGFCLIALILLIGGGILALHAVKTPSQALDGMRATGKDENP